MVGCVLSQLKPSELHILSCGKGRGLIYSYVEISVILVINIGCLSLCWYQL